MTLLHAHPTLLRRVSALLDLYISRYRRQGAALYSGAMRDRAPGLAARSIHADNQLDNRNTMDFQTDDDILR
jgi:hypothetical protein